MRMLRQAMAFLAGAAIATGCGIPAFKAIQAATAPDRDRPALVDAVGPAPLSGAAWPYARVIGGAWEILGLSTSLDLSGIYLDNPGQRYPGEELLISGVPTGAGQIRVLIDAPGQTRIAGFIRQTGPSQIALVVPMLPGGMTGNVAIRVSVRNALSLPMSITIARPISAAGSFQQILALVDGSSASGSLGTYGTNLWADYAKDPANAESLVSVYNGNSPTVTLDASQRQMLDDVVWASNLHAQLQWFLGQAPASYGYGLQYIEVNLPYEQIRADIDWANLSYDELYRLAAKVASSLATYYGPENTQNITASYLVMRLMNAFPLLKELMGASLPRGLNGISAANDELGCNRQDLDQWGTIQATGDFWLSGLPSYRVSRLAGAPLATLWPTAAYLNPSYAISQFQAMANITSASLNRAGVVASGTYAIEPRFLRTDITPMISVSTSEATVNDSPIATSTGPVSDWVPYATANAKVIRIENNRFQMSQCGCAVFDIQSVGMPNGADIADTAVLFTRGMNLSVEWITCDVDAFCRKSNCRTYPGPSDAKLVVEGATISQAYTGRYYWDGRDGWGNLMPQGVAINAELWASGAGICPNKTYGIHDYISFPYGCDFLRIQSLPKRRRPAGGLGRIGL